MKTVLKILLKATLFVLVIDFLGAAAWAFSGQQPPANAYVGTITTHTIQWLIYPRN